MIVVETQTRVDVGRAEGSRFVGHTVAVGVAKGPDTAFFIRGPELRLSGPDRRINVTVVPDDDVAVRHHPFGEKRGRETFREGETRCRFEKCSFGYGRLGVRGAAGHQDHRHEEDAKSVHEF